MKIGFVGLGNMGMAISTRLQDSGLDLRVWNRSPRELPAGIRAAATLDELVDHSDVVFSMLADDAASLEIVPRLLQGDVKNKTFVEMATVRLDTVQRLASMVAAKGAHFADLPVAGTVAPARAGKLVALAGGPAEVITTLTPLVETFSRRVVHCGPVGAGMAMKHSVNSLLGVYFAGLAEALGAGAAAGLSVEQILDVVMDTPAGLPALAAKLDIVKGATPPAAFSLSGAAKDLDVIATSGRQNGLKMAVIEQALATFRRCEQQGHGREDLAYVARTYLGSEP